MPEWLTVFLIWYTVKTKNELLKIELLTDIVSDYINILECKYNENINDLNRVIKKHSPSIASVAIGASWLFIF